MVTSLHSNLYTFSSKNKNKKTENRYASIKHCKSIILHHLSPSNLHQINSSPIDFRTLKKLKKTPIKKSLKIARCCAIAKVAFHAKALVLSTAASQSYPPLLRQLFPPSISRGIQLNVMRKAEMMLNDGWFEGVISIKLLIIICCRNGGTVTHTIIILAFHPPSHKHTHTHTYMMVFLLCQTASVSSLMTVTAENGKPAKEPVGGV